MDQSLSKYKKMAYLSYQLILHYQHMLSYSNAIVLLLNVKHISDSHYQPIILTVPKNIPFLQASWPAFIHIFENFQNYKKYSEPSLHIKSPFKRVIFNDIVQVRNMSKYEDYYEFLTK